MKPTLKHIKCIAGKSKKGKFLPRRARISCVDKQDSKAMRSMGSTAEETCGYMPVQIAEPASYFCEDMACHFYCPDNLKVVLKVFFFFIRFELFRKSDETNISFFSRLTTK